MAITYITGVPKSGKTYFSVYTIWKMYRFDLFKYNVVKQWFWFYFPPKRKEIYSFTYTNIKGFNFEFNPQIKPLIWRDLYKKLERLHSYYLADKSEEYLIEKSKEYGLFNSLFVIDECQNHFNKKEDEVLVWWLTYHAHLHHEIHLITQHMKLIADKYKGIAEYFYKVSPSSKSNFKNMFTIGFYSSGEYYKNTFVKAIHIPVKQDIFKMYTAGKPEKRAQQLTIILTIIPVLIILLVGLMINFMGDFGGSKDNNESTIKELHQNTSKYKIKHEIISVTHQDKNITIKTPINFNKETLLTFNCIGRTCSYQNINIPLTFLIYYIKNHDPNYYDIMQITPLYTQYTFLSNKDFKIFLMQNAEFKTDKKVKGDNKNEVPSFNVFGN